MKATITPAPTHVRMPLNALRICAHKVMFVYLAITVAITNLKMVTKVVNSMDLKTLTLQDAIWQLKSASIPSLSVLTLLSVPLIFVKTENVTNV